MRRPACFVCWIGRPLYTFSGRIGEVTCMFSLLDRSSTLHTFSGRIGEVTCKNVYFTFGKLTLFCLST